jgi:PKD repeat protein
MKQLFVTLPAVAAVLAFSGACTMKKQEAPALAGPSGVGTSIAIAVTPDVLQQDGASQSVITATAFGPNGSPLANLSLRAEISVNGTLADFGSLSARSVVTDANGRATLVYTAPAAAPVAIDNFTIVDIGITPVGSDFNNSMTRFASLRLVPRGIIVPPDGLRPSFTINPASPTDNQTVLFDASASTAPANNPISSYSWDFGDRRQGSGRTTSHVYSDPGTYVATLTVSDALGRSASTSQSLTVSPGSSPTARFAVSPTNPNVGVTVNFNAVASTPAPGRSIVSYTWDLGDGSPQATGVQVARAYGRAGTYTITLTDRDDVGRTSTLSQTLTVAP